MKDDRQSRATANSLASSRKSKFVCLPGGKKEKQNGRTIGDATGTPAGLFTNAPSPPALLFSCGETNHAASRRIIRSVQIWLNYSDARGCVKQPLDKQRDSNSMPGTSIDKYMLPLHTYHFDKNAVGNI